MYTLFPPGIGRWGPILALGLVLGVAAGTGRALADDAQPENPPSDEPTPVFWQGYQPTPTCPWYVSADGMAVQRLFRGLGPIASEGPIPPGTSFALSQQSLAEPFNAGVGVLLGHSFDDTPYQVEASYFWINPWNTSAEAIDPTGMLFSPFTSGSTPNSQVDYNTLVQIHEISRLEGGDVNLKCKLSLPEGDPTIMLMFGVRHGAVREEFDYVSYPSMNANMVTVRAHTNNDLWGPQIGGLVDCGHQDVWIHVEGKVALCDNESNRDLSASVNGIDATHPRFFNSGTATIGDINASIFWRPFATLTVRVGYQAMWYDQLALAARNFATDLNTLTDPLLQPSMNTRGTLIYHGPTAGLQWCW